MSQSSENKSNSSSDPSTRREFIRKAGVAGMIAAGTSQQTSGQDSADGNKDQSESSHDPRLKPNIWTYVDKAHKYEFPSGDPKATEIWMYSDRMSYTAGDEVIFYVHTTEPTHDIRIERYGGTIELSVDKVQKSFKTAAPDRSQSRY